MLYYKNLISLILYTKSNDKNVGYVVKMFRLVIENI